MAQIASLAPHQHPPRISQSLPTVKCSNCSQLVPFADLGDHLCPPLPHSLQKPPVSPKSSSFLPKGLQNLVSNRAGTPASARTPPPHASPRPEPDPFQRMPPNVHYSNMLPTPVNSPPIPISSRTPPPQSILHNVGTSPGPHVRFIPPGQSTTPPIAIRTRTPSNAANGPKSPPGGSSFPNPFERDPSQSSASMRPRTPSARKESSPVASHGRTRTPSNAPSHNSIIPPNLTPRPSFDRTRTPSTLAPRPSLDKQRPSLDAPRPSFEARRPSFDVPRTKPVTDVRRPSFDVPRTQPPTDARRPSFDIPRTQPPTDIRRPSFDVPRPSTDRTQPHTGPIPPPPEPVSRPPRRTATIPPSSGIPFPSSTHAPQSATRTVPDNIDTKCGGEAGMAGVGRRGFAAAARAAMYAGSLPYPDSNRSIPPAMDGRHANAPKYLDINAAMNHVMRAAMTPPLSPNSGYSHSPVSPRPVSPLSPAANLTPIIGQFPKIPHDIARGQLHSSSPNHKHVPLSSSLADIHVVTPSRTPSPISNHFTRHLSGETVTQSPFSAVPVRLPFLDAFDKVPANGGGEDDSDEESVYTTHTTEPRRHRKDHTAPMSPSTDSEPGLAYADDSDNDTPVVMPLDVRKSSTLSGTNKIKFPSVEDKHPPSSVRKPPSRKASASSATSYSTSRTANAGPGCARSASSATHTTTRSGGALERAMETLIEEGASISVLASGSLFASVAGSSGRGSTGKPNRSNTVPGPVSPDHKPPKLPARSYTSLHHPHIHSERVGVTGEVACIRERGKGKGRKDRICARCDLKIEDGRWIQMDGGNVLCERCWKNMYLPKCRRCNLPIEKQAVSSSDGQLKGKYHRDCFNCHICQKTFPDKEFYVFDGKPLCAYHYHEANDSLCAAVSCGQPIEGPCAVTHAGKRYHPEHLLCEFENGCGERLAEYWEVDGQMFCEKHIVLVGGSNCASSVRGDSPDIDGQRVKDEGRARKRMTRFIDLGAGEDDATGENVDIR